jgi:hypothetical protein
MNKSQRGGEPLVLAGGSLGDLAFHWSGDRYGHRWQFASEHGLQIMSVESSSETVWPLSPPLQQIHQQSFGDGRQVVFGVGMAGRGHWSASFTLVPDLKCWIVELACRAPIEHTELLSTYRLTGNWMPTESGASSNGHQGPPLRLDAIGPSSVAKFESSSQAPHEHQLSVSPNRLAEGTETAQWAFRLSV